MKNVARFACLFLLLALAACKAAEVPVVGDPVVGDGSNVTKVTLDATSRSMVEGSFFQLIATISFYTGSDPDLSVSWSSSDPGIASVSALGIVSAVSAGTATITVTTTEGGRTASCVVSVTEFIPVESIFLVPDVMEMGLGCVADLHPTIEPGDASDQVVSWSSNSYDRVAVDEAGKISSLDAGTATITVTTRDGGKSATCTVTVSPDPLREITFASLPVSVGGTATLIPSFTPEYATHQDLVWSSGDEAIATVDQDGTVTGVAAGEVWIMARHKYSGLYDERLITVTVE